MNVGAPELLIVLLVVLLLFGGSKLPELARGLGAAKGEFERGVKEGEARAASAEPERQTDGIGSDGEAS